MATAKKTKSGKFKCRVYSHTDDLGKKHYRAFTASTKKEAEQLALLFKVDNDEETMTFGQRAERYLAKKSNVLSPSTIRSYRCMLDQLNENYVKFCKKTRICSDDVQNLINNLAEDHSPKSCKNYLSFVSAVLGANGHFIVTLPQSIKNEVKVPTEAEFKAILTDIEGTEIEVPVLLGSFCMMRRSEICGLKLSDIEGNIIHIHRNRVRDLHGKYIEKTTKTPKSDRYISAPDFVIDKIQSKGYITTLTPAAISDAFHRIVVRLGIDGVTFHGLRHWGASYRHSVLNIPTAYIQQDGGWSNPRTLENIYRHALEDNRQAYSDRVNKAFSEMYDPIYDLKKEKVPKIGTS